MTENQINTRDKYRDNLLSFVSDKYVCTVPESSDDDKQWLGSFVEEVSNYFYNSGYNDAMESTEIECNSEEKHELPIGAPGDDNDDVIFAPKLDDISDEELINELRSRGYKGTLSINKDIEL